MFPHSAATNSTSRFMPSNNQSFAPRPGLSPVQPSSPTQVQAQPAPPAPPPTVQTADTTKVSGMLNADARLKASVPLLLDYLISPFLFWFQGFVFDSFVISYEVYQMS